MDPLRVAVVGCGTAGSAAALFLRRLGHSVEVFERVPDPGPVGAALLMQPSGMGALRELGLLDHVLELGEPVHRLLGTTASGHIVIDLRYERLSPDLYGIGLHRGTLFETLVGAVERADIAIHRGVEIVGVRSTDPAVLIDAERNEHGPFDLAVVADGARSRLREAAGIEHSVRKYGWGAVWATVATDSDVASNTLRQHLFGTRKMLGLLPAGRRPESGDRRVLSLFWSMRLRDGEAVARGDFDFAAWKDELLGMSETTAPLLDEIRSPDQLTFAAYYDVKIARPALGRLVFIGDAAHATSPQLGHGANLGLVDAQQLGAAIAREGDVARALAAFVWARRSQIAYYRRASRLLTPWFQSDLNLLALPRDHILGPVGRRGPLNRQMLLTLAGVKRSTLRALPRKEWPDLPSLAGRARS